MSSLLALRNARGARLGAVLDTDTSVRTAIDTGTTVLENNSESSSVRKTTCPGAVFVQTCGGVSK